MKAVFVSDIFGKTLALSALANKVNAGKSIIIDPYQGRDMLFSDEDAAYQYFTSQVGLTEYYKDLQQKLSTIEEPFTLIGFSIGASVCWQYVANCQNNFLKRAELLYGSQIRNLTGLTPKVKTNLIFPCSEPHFSVDALIAVLENKDNTLVKKNEYLHGFMNKLSNNFHQKAYEKHVEYLRELLE